MTRLLFLILLGSLYCDAKTPDLNRLTDEQLWDSSDFIGIVTVASGKYFANKGYELSGDVKAILKGNGKKYVHFKNMFPSMNTANILGSTYLVYLREDADNSYFVPSENFAIVELVERNIEDENAINDIGKEYGVQYAHSYEYEGKLWHVQCWPQSARFCNELAKSADVAFNKAKQQGPAAGTR
ncbi:hypothetical protein [Haliea salexigens]|uniref:hypothetical protein n=1 Tax=Haliea salexigens TaxID=287487 RepID=UPI001183004A|nr:hypothetical protein [Haliea salexigens]